jgi:hypothetical protein
MLLRACIVLLSSKTGTCKASHSADDRLVDIEVESNGSIAAVSSINVFETTFERQEDLNVFEASSSGKRPGAGTVAALPSA